MTTLLLESPFGDGRKAGEATTVIFNGHRYAGTVLGFSKTRVLIRFTTGSGRTRERWFGNGARWEYLKATPPPTDWESPHLT